MAIAAEIGLAAIIACALLTTVRLADWRSDITLYEAAAGHAPGSARLWGNLAVLYVAAGRADAARGAAQPRQTPKPQAMLFSSEATQAAPAASA